ncbi:MAG: hypothetical protein AB7F43_12440 [Bacteriovoracia bacterium]
MQSPCVCTWTFANRGILIGLACSVALHAGLVAMVSQVGKPMMSPKPQGTLDLGTIVITVPKKHKVSHVSEI